MAGNIERDLEKLQADFIVPLEKYFNGLDQKPSVAVQLEKVLTFAGFSRELERFFSKVSRLDDIPRVELVRLENSLKNPVIAEELRSRIVDLFAYIKSFALDVSMAHGSEGYGLDLNEEDKLQTLLDNLNLYHRKYSRALATLKGINAELQLVDSTKES